MKDKKIPPIHPDEILLEEFLTPMNLSQNKIALDMRVPPRRINEIVLGKRRITADRNYIHNVNRNDYNYPFGV